jgi:hypothetical protein
MFIVPFIHNIVDQATIKINVIKILTIGGKILWEEKNSLDIDKDILNPNDIYKKNKIIKYDKVTQLCEVDITKTNISDFYKWDEIDINDNETFCWRSYIYLTGVDGIIWLNIPETEKLGKYLVKDLIMAIILKK